MRLGAFSVVDAFPGPEEATRDRFAELAELTVAAERAGLSGLWVAEHHFHPGGLCPSPAVLLAALGALTRTLRLGPMVSVLPFHRPVDLAEEYALLDRLLGGRLNLGLGSGYIPLEFEGFGIDPASKRERFETALAAISSAFRGEEFPVDGANGPKVRLSVRPLQQPSPPIVVAAQRREAIAHLARRGLSVALIPYATLGGLEELRAVVEEFRENRPKGSAAQILAAVHLYVGGDPSEGLSALQSYLDLRRATQSTNYLAKVAHDPRQSDARTVVASGLAVVGRRPAARKALAALRATGLDELLGIFDFGGLPSTAAVRSLRTAATLLKE